MKPVAAARVKVGVSRVATSGLSLKLRPGDWALKWGGGGSTDRRTETMLSDAERRFLAFKELVGDGRPDVGGRGMDSCSDTAPSVSSNMVNSASVMRALSLLLTGGTIVLPECDDSASETGRGDLLPDRAPGRTVVWLAMVESLFLQSSFDFSLSCEPPFSEAIDAPASPVSEGYRECWT